MALNPNFWHPTKKEWEWLCEVRTDLDPAKRLFTKEGEAIAIWLSDKPEADLEKGRQIVEAREEEKRKKQAEDLVRTEEEMHKSMIEHEKLRQRLIRQAEKAPEYHKKTQQRQALKRKAMTTDDPFEASVLNAVDKDRRAANGNFIIHARRISDLPKIALSDAEEVRERVDWYFQLCVTDGVRPNLPGLALAFGLTRTGLMNAVSDRRMPRDAAQEIGRGIAMIDEIVSQMTLGGYVQPVAAIYLMNNWLGYKNASEVTTRTEPVDNSVDQKALEQKYSTVVDME